MCIEGKITLPSYHLFGNCQDFRTCMAECHFRITFFQPDSAGDQGSSKRLWRAMTLKTTEINQVFAPENWMVERLLSFWGLSAYFQERLLLVLGSVNQDDFSKLNLEQVSADDINDIATYHFATLIKSAVWLGKDAFWTDVFAWSFIGTARGLYQQGSCVQLHWISSWTLTLSKYIIPRSLLLPPFWHFKVIIRGWYLVQSTEPFEQLTKTSI